MWKCRTKIKINFTTNTNPIWSKICYTWFNRPFVAVQLCTYMTVSGTYMESITSQTKGLTQQHLHCCGGCTAALLDTHEELQEINHGHMNTCFKTICVFGNLTMRPFIGWWITLWHPWFWVSHCPSILFVLTALFLLDKNIP